MRIRRARSVFGPAVLPDQRYESDRTKLFVLVFALADSRDLAQRLMKATMADRDDEAAANGKLLLERLRHLGAACGDENGIEGLGIGPSLGAIARPQLDVVISQI